MLEGDDRLRVVEGGRGVEGLRGELGGTRQAGGVGHAHDLALDGRAEDGAQQLHRHPWEEDERVGGLRQGETLTADVRISCEILTVGRGRIPFLLLRADEHGEGRVRHVEALIWGRTEKNRVGELA